MDDHRSGIDDQQVYRKNAVIALAFIAVCLVITLPVLRAEFLPLTDLPNHIARHFIATMEPGPLDTYYEYTFELIPNTAADLAWQFFGNGGDPVAFSKYTIVFYLISLIVATMVLARVVHGRWTLWSVAVGLVAYNANFYWGFQNYIVTMPFAIFALALWLWSERFPVVVRLALLSPLIAGIYILHLFAFVFLAIAAFGRELQLLIVCKGHRKEQFIRSLLMGLPFVVLLVYLLYGIVSGPPNPGGTESGFGGWNRRLEAIQAISMATVQFTSLSLRTTGLLILAFVCLSALAIRYPVILGGLYLSDKMKGPLVAVFVLTLLTPFLINGVAYVHIRFGFALVAMMIAATTWRRLSVPSQWIVTGAVCLLLVSRSLGMSAYTEKHQSEVRDFLQVAQEVPAGDRLFFVRMDRRVSDIRQWHLSVYAIPFAEVFVPTLFQGVHAFSVKEEWKAYSAASVANIPYDILLDDEELANLPSGLELLEGWDTRYTHLAVMDSSVSGFDDLVLHPALQLVAERGRFRLYRINAPQVSGGGDRSEELLCRKTIASLYARREPCFSSRVRNARVSCACLRVRYALF